jgi:hypothetical protein
MLHTFNPANKLQIYQNLCRNRPFQGQVNKPVATGINSQRKGHEAPLNTGYKNVADKRNHSSDLEEPKNRRGIRQGLPQTPDCA